MAVSLTEFEKALDSLHIAITEPKSDLVRDATIQRFEFSIELAWKTSKKVMGTATSAPKQVIREMAQNNLIEDVEFWLEAIDMRNLSVHTYNEDLADQVYDFAIRFHAQAGPLLAKLKSL